MRKNTPNYSPVVQEVNTNPHTIRPTRKILSTAEMRARREKGLCYNCEEQFTPGHKCKRSHMFFLITKKEQVDYLAPTQGTNQLNESQREEMVISSNAMPGSSGVNTIKVQGFKGKHILNILIDTGSSSSFISESLAY